MDRSKAQLNYEVSVETITLVSKVFPADFKGEMIDKKWS